MKNIPIEGDVLPQVLTAMKKSDMLSDLSENSLTQIAARAQLIQFDPDEIIIQEKDAADSFFLLISGEVAVLYHQASVEEAIELGRIKPIRVIGEIGLLLNDPRSATIKAIETTRMLRFDSALFNYMFENVPAFGPNVCRNLALRVQQLSARMPLPQLDKNAPPPPRDVVLMLPIDFIIRHRVLPLSVTENKLRIGFINDPNTNVIGAIRRFLPSMELQMVHIDNAYFDTVVGSVSGVQDWSAAEEKPVTDTSEDTVVSPKLDQLLKRLVGEGASDLHLSAGHPPYWRIDGDLKPIQDASPLGHEEVLELLSPVMDRRTKNNFYENKDVDFIYAVPDLARFRVNMFYDDQGISAVLRFIPSKILTFEQLGLPETLKSLCDHPKGLVLVTGPTGSGKSTTLAAMINYINQNRHEHIVTMEDPIEFAHTSQKSLINQREIGRHAKSYARALTAALREDPDIILVGEMRDLETIALALETSNTGHLVFGTLHTATAISTMARVIDAFPPDQQDQVRVSLADSLVGVVSQDLCKCRDGGRVAAIEVLVVNLAISNLIREQKYNQIASMMQTGKAQGNILLNEALEKLVKRKKIEYKRGHEQGCGQKGPGPQTRVLIRAPARIVYPHRNTEAGKHFMKKDEKVPPEKSPQRSVDPMEDFHQDLQELVIRQARKLINAHLHTKALLSTLPVALIAADKDGYILTINQAAEEILGVTEKDLEGRFISDLLAANPEAMEKAEKALALGRPFHMRSKSIRLESGKELVGNLYFQPFSDDEEEIHGILVTLEDQTYVHFLQDAFKHYVPPSVSEIIAQDPQRLELGGEDKVLSVLFSDLVGFTSIAEKYSPKMVPFSVIISRK